MIDAIGLGQDLIRFETINPPGNEAPCARFLGGILDQAGFTVDYYSLGDNRESLIAKIGGSGAGLPICFSGHTDVVPLGAAAWSVAPFGAVIEDGKLYGRGSTDMKCGVAAFVAAAVELASRLKETCGLVLVITAGEEVGCEGAKRLAAEGVLPEAGAMVIAEPTANQVMAGHKGVLWLEGRAQGVTAHGSMPERGVNAVYKAAKAALAIEAFNFSPYAHPALGAPTASVGWLRGGMNVNSVPDEARLGVDVRTVPGLDPRTLVKHLSEAVGSEVDFEIRGVFDPVWTDPSDDWVHSVHQLVTARTNLKMAISGATYFTDASALKPAMGNPPTIILGPGEPGLAHQTDEFCYLDKMEAAEVIYSNIIRAWCGLS